MTKSCIVCGNVARSKEHVFPAALGGRRTNSGIYCSQHDNSYAPLVNEVAEQLDFLNAYLGIRPDHSGKIKTAYAADSQSGEMLAISATEIKPMKSRVISSVVAGGGVLLELASPDMQSADQWIADKKSNGYTVSVQSKPFQRKSILGSIHHERTFGGPCALGAAAYIAQTFFAQEFPDIARSGAMSSFIAYTQAIAKVSSLGGCELVEIEGTELAEARSILDASLAATQCAAPVWWDFTPPVGATPNAFEFGHRVTVGVDGFDGQIYGRVSLFSTLNFAVLIGTVPRGFETREIVVDIDPLAEHPPNDIRKVASVAAHGRVEVPKCAPAALANALANGALEQAFDDLLIRLTDHQLIKLAQRMKATLAQCSAMPPPQARELIERVLDEQSQQIWRAASFVIQGFKETLVMDGKATMVSKLDSLVAMNPQYSSGLSPQAEETLALAKLALADQMALDLAADLLSEDRIADLMGRGPGLNIVGQAVLARL